MQRNQEERRRTIKSLLVACTGGGCCKCAYNRYLGALDFHHLSDKKEKVGELLRQHAGLARIFSECLKCVLLCQNCHKELHGGLWSLSDINVVRFDITEAIALCPAYGLVLRQRRPQSATCRQCDCEFAPTKRSIKYCSARCAAAAKRKTIRPSKAELDQLIWSTPATTLALRFGVSDKAIAKWAHSYGLSLPGVGYWKRQGK